MAVQLGNTGSHRYRSKEMAVKKQKSHEKTKSDVRESCEIIKCKKCVNEVK